LYRQGKSCSDIFKPFIIKSQMRHGEALEFEGFAPHLDDLAQRLFILHAVIYLSFNCIFSKHVPEDNELWPKAKAALFKEANDFVLAFVSSSREGHRLGAIGVADLFRPVVPKGIYQYTFKITAPKEYCPSLVKSMTLPLTSREKAAAEKLVALNSVDQYSTSWMRNSLDIGVSPSLQYLPLLAYPYCHLLNWANVSDSTFIDNQLISTYLPFLESHCIQSIAHAFTPQVENRCEDLSDRKGISRVIEDDSCLLISTPVIAFCEAFDQACSALYHLQIIQPEMETLLTTMCRMFLEKVTSRVEHLLHNGNSSSNDAESVKCISGVFAKDRDLYALLSQHLPINSSGPQQKEPNKEYQVSLEEIQILARLKTDRSLLRDELLKSADSIISLLIINQSLTLLPSLLKRERGKLSGLTSVYSENSGGDYYCVYLGVEPNEVYKFGETFSTNLSQTMNELGRLGRMCLFAVRSELRAICMYHLDLAFREGHYHPIDGLDYLHDGGPDPHVDRLCAALIVFQEAVKAASIDKPTFNFIFSGLPVHVEHLLVHNVKYIRGPISKRDPRLRVLGENLRALEQIIQAVSEGGGDTMGGGFKRARAYYDLLGMSTVQMMQVLEETKDHPAFTLSEYQAILKLHYSGGNEDDDKEYLNQLVRLKYLLESKQGV
jgi:hypothetical protein